jgi:acyl-CoA dehydrogenase
VVDFAQPPEVEELVEATRRFVREVCIPAEGRHTGHELDADLRAELQQKAREARIFAPHVSPEYGGRGLDMRARAPVFEAAGYSPLGPQAMNFAAPDEGNQHMLELIASAEQKERYLAPLARGETRSCFSMTEPPPGSGSDPSMLQTRAERRSGGWAINGEKRLVTGAIGAAFTICMARTDDKVERGKGATMFLVDADNPGWRVGRPIPTVDSNAIGGHCEVFFEDCFVPDEAVLGEPGLGFQYAQVRLAPARLTHCMRWLGIARRALDIALDRSAEREAFGQKIQDLGLAQQLIADSEIDIETCGPLILHACWILDSGGDGIRESSIAKVYVSEAVWRVVDRAVQLCGGVGVSYDAPLARFLNDIRPFRIYDGPSEVHRWSIARRAVKRRRLERESQA